MTEPTVDALAAALPHDWAAFYGGRFGDELDVERLVAAQAAALADAGYVVVRAEDGLDVERLTEAIRRAGVTQEDDMNMESRWVTRPIRSHQAPQVAAEYSALATKETP